MQDQTTSQYGAVIKRIALLCVVFSLAACSAVGHIPNSGPMGFAKRKDSAPLLKLDPRYIKDAVPRADPVTQAGNKSPYTVLGKTYSVLPNARGYHAEGVASWYGTKFHGRKTSNGERYSLYGMTAAHKTLPIPCYVKVTNLENNRTAIVRVNDRGPFHDNRIIDLSYAAASKLGYAGKGTAKVRVEVVTVHDPLRPIAVAAASPPPGNSATSAPAPTAASPKTAAATATPAVTNARPLATTPANAKPASTHNAGREQYLQAGAFREYDSAQALQQRLQKILLKPVAVLSSQNLFKVHIGPLAMNEVEHVRQMIISADLGNPHLVKNP